jgi:hypothetical protein
LEGRQNDRKEEEGMRRSERKREDREGETKREKPMGGQVRVALLRSLLDH